MGTNSILFIIHYIVRTERFSPQALIFLFQPILGIDLNSLVDLSQNANEFDDVARKARYLYKTIRFYQDGISSLERCAKPVIGVSHSACVGAGVDLLTAADMRLVSYKSRIPDRLPILCWQPVGKVVDSQVFEKPFDQCWFLPSTSVNGNIIVIHYLHYIILLFIIHHIVPIERSTRRLIFYA